MLASATWPALGTTAAVVVTQPRAIAGARALLEDELDRIDHACSRFRDDSELSRANARAGEPFAASRLFAEAVRAALRVAEATGGAVDPTVGRSMRNIGYDRDFARLGADMPAPVVMPGAPGWRSIRLDSRSGLLFMPPGTELDLGATAKALAADRAARRIQAELGCGVLVNLGGDISAMGSPPSGGWPVAVGDDHADAGPGAGQTISIPAGGLATSSTTVRRWSAGGRPCHHIVDPRTGTSASVVWRTVSVAAGSCVDANAASTASIVRGSSAPHWLAGLSLPSRLVSAGGDVVRVAGWPREET
jgi:thiamine biosynthesis lipoprotein